MPSNTAGNNSGNPTNISQKTNANKARSLEDVLDAAGFWNEFGLSGLSRDESGGTRGLRKMLIDNLCCHMDLAWQEIQNPTGNHLTLENGRDDVISYIEGSSAFWGDPNWIRPVDYTPTPVEDRKWGSTPTLCPYVIWGDKHVREREVEIRKTHVQHTSPTQIRVDPEKKQWGLRPVTKEEADFMDQFLDYSNCEDEKEDEGVEMD